MKVLIVQSEGPSAGLLGSLSRYGVRILVGTSAATALEIANTVELRAIVADFRLIDRSGVWLLDQFRIQFPQTQRILSTDEPRIEPNRLVEHQICHMVLRRPYPPSVLLNALAGVPEHAHLDETPIISVLAPKGPPPLPARFRRI